MATAKIATQIVERETATTISTTTKVVALDDTNAKELLAKFQANKANKSALEAEYKALQADIYALLGYTKVGDSWIGVAEQGTIAGTTVVTVGTQTREKFDNEGFLKAHPDLLSAVADFTSKATNTVLKTPTHKHDK